jgi:hypothetical protein
MPASDSFAVELWSSVFGVLLHLGGTEVLKVLMLVNEDWKVLDVG